MPFPTDREPPAFDDPAVLTSVIESGCRVYRDVRYARVPGFRPMRLDLTVPDVGAATPVVVYLHGGAWLFDDRLQGSASTLDQTVLSRLLDAGIAVANVDYRLSGELPFPGCLHDAVAAVRYLRSHAATLGLDPARILAFGASAGGYLAAFLAAGPRDPELLGSVGVGTGDASVAAAVAWFPPTTLTWSLDDGHSPESMLLGSAAANSERVAWASPISHVTESSAPILLVHGDSDRLVPYEQSTLLRDAYERAGASAELVTAAGADHGFHDVDPAALIDRTVEFLVRHAG